MITRIKIGPEVVPSDDAITNPFDVENPFRRNTATVYPFRNGLRRNANSAGEISLGAECLKSRGENVIAHEPSYIHAQFIGVNRGIIDHPPQVYEHGVMPSPIPQPENCATFAAWVRALSQYAGSQAALAKGVGVSPQMITKYLRGKSLEAENLEKFAAYSGVSYAKLRMLVDGKPVSEAKSIKDRINQTATPMGAQIGRQWETIQDERSRNLIAEQIKVAIEQQSKLESASRKRAG